MPTPTERQQTKGLWLGLLGVAVFAMTLPMTRLAVGPATAPQLPPAFVTAGRAALAGLLSLAWLGSAGVRRLDLRHLPTLAVSALGTVLGFPLCLAFALREVEAMHAAVVSGLIPLVTALAAALYFRQRPSVGFWICAALGSALVVAFAVQQGNGRVSAGDGWLLAAVVCTSIGYVAGARVGATGRQSAGVGSGGRAGAARLSGPSRNTLAPAGQRPASAENAPDADRVARRPGPSPLPGEQIICWVLVISLPFTVPLAVFYWPMAPVRPASWGGFAYVSVFSMWLGFFAWYRGMALGGAVRVSQVQLVQPFPAVLFAVPVLGEPLDATTLGFSLAVIAVVFVGRRMSVAAPAPVPRRS